MGMTVEVDVRDESSMLDVVKVDVPEIAGLGRGRTLALIAFGALSAWGFFRALGLAEPTRGSAAEATEQLVRRAEEPTAMAVAIMIVLIVAVAGAAAAAALHRHAD